MDYLLGELAPDERAAIERRMREDPGFRREVERMRPVVAGLEALPSDAWERPEVPPLPDLPRCRRHRPPSRPGSRWPAWAPVAAVAACAALIAAGLGIGALVFGGDGEDDAGPAIALARVDDGGPSAAGEARVVSSEAGGLRLRVSGLDPSGPGGFYELWLLDGPERLLSLGAFRVPGVGRGGRDRAAAGGRHRLPLHRCLGGSGGRRPGPLGRLGAAGADRPRVITLGPTPWSPAPPAGRPSAAG